MGKVLFLILVLLAPSSYAAVPTESKPFLMYDAAGNAINSTGNALNINAASLPLPAGAATSANQTTASTSLSTIATNTGNIPSVGQKVMASSSPVVIASDQSAIPITGSITASNPSVSTTGSAVPASATMAGGSDGTNLRALKVSNTGVVSVDGSAVTQPVSGTISAAQSGTWNINNVSGTVSLPTGAATSAKQPALGTAGSASSDVISVQGVASMTALKVDGSAVTQPVSAASLPLPSGASTAAKQPALGTAGTASSDVITVQGIASMTALKVDGSAVTQPVSAASLPLPSGAATSANQTTANSSLSSIDGKIPSSLTVTSTRLLVDGSGVTQPISIASAVLIKDAINPNGSHSTNTSISNSAATTLSVPANAVGFVLEASSANTQNLRWAVGATATTSAGMRLEPGRDTGYIPGAANISVIAEAGSGQEVEVQWILNQ